MQGRSMRVRRGDTRSLNYGSCGDYRFLIWGGYENLFFVWILLSGGAARAI